jgi:hypothetical protein
MNEELNKDSRKLYNKDYNQLSDEEKRRLYLHCLKLEKKAVEELFEARNPNLFK